MRRFASVFGTAAVLFLTSLVLPSDVLGQPANTSADLIARADAIVGEAVRTDQFSGSVLVAKDGIPVYRRSFGLADREWDVPNIPESKFELASVTKSFTATSILLLQERGLISVDDLVAKYYTDAPSSWKSITVKQLLTHTSGIPDYESAPDFYERIAVSENTPLQLIQLVHDKPLKFAPGSQFAYSNTGYVVLGYIIEKISGLNYSEFVQRNIYKPLGMANSGYDSVETVTPHLSRGYQLEKGAYIKAPLISFTTAYSAGALYSTADDLLRWDQSFYSGKLLSPRSLASAMTDYGNGYGYGWFVDKKFGRTRISHGGLIYGFAASLDRYPDEHLTVIVLANESNSPAPLIGSNLAALYLGVPPRTPAPGGEAALRDVIGGLVTGKPDYSRLTPHFAQLARSQLSQLHEIVSAFGSLKSMSLTAADPGGSDRYRVVFDRGVFEWSIRIEGDGRVSEVGFHEVP